MKKSVALGAAAAILLGLGFFVQRNLSEVPVLMYHLIEVPVKQSSVYVHPDTFDKQMEFLKLHRYRVVSLDVLMQELKAGTPPPKTVAITFDDGTLDNFRNAFPILRKMDFPATIFMITANIDRPGWLTSEDLKILDESGITIGSHTVNHAFLPELTPDEARVELTESKRVLEELLGHEVKYFSYPAGGVTPELKELVKEAGYHGAVTTNYGRGRHDPYMLHRVKVSDSSRNLFNFWLKVSGLYRIGKRPREYRPSEEAPSGYGA
jgi:peptidoglycan/xylan/chitin deacetylase (PgdA/CDA1 family)